jgi:DNA-binding NarL/FixJ family response regulator
MIRLFIADDHALLREGLARLFGAVADIELVGEAKDGAQVLRRTAEGGIDVLLLDLCMPGLSGIDLIREIRSATPALPILVLSMHEESQFALRAIRSGAQGYLCKDSDFEHILAAVRRLAAGRLYLSPGVAEQLAWDAMQPDTALAHTQLSIREHEVFQLLVEGKSIGEISGLLDLSVKTVSTHKTRIMHKMRMTSLSEMVQYAVAYQLLP